MKTIRDTVTKMKVVLPFEEAMYREERVDAEFVGHPLAEILRTTRSREQFAADFGLEPEARLLALLPGSRLQEIHHILPAMLGAAEIIRRRNNVQVAVGVAPNLGPEPFARYGLEQRGVRMIEGATYDLMAYADAAVVTSGTATLETGWFGTPMVIVYRTSPITYAIGRLVVNVPCIGLVNILAGRKLVPELIQADCNAEKLAGELTPLVFDESRNGTMRQDLAVIKSLLGAPGASQKVARAVLELVDAA